MLFFIRLSHGWLLELILTTNKYLLIIELMTFNAKTRVFYNIALIFYFSTPDEICFIVFRFVIFFETGLRSGKDFIVCLIASLLFKSVT